MDAFLLQILGGVQSAHGHLAAGDHQNVAAVTQQLGLADLKMIIILIQHDGNTVAAQQTHIHGAFKLGYGFGSLHISTASQGSIIVRLGMAPRIARSSVA